MELREVKERAQVKTLAALADAIWHEYFTSLLNKQQIDYMVDKFLSVSAIERQREEGYIYLLAEQEGQAVGFTCAQPRGEVLFISKVYVEKESRGKGYASIMHDHWIDFCHKNHLKKEQLTINRHNDLSLAVHLKRGFRIVRQECNDIGGGFVMDDHILELTISD